MMLNLIAPAASVKGEGRRGSYPSYEEPSEEVDLLVLNSEDACVKLKTLYGREKVESSSILTSPNITATDGQYLYS